MKAKIQFTSKDCDAGTLAMVIHTTGTFQMDQDTISVRFEDDKSTPPGTISFEIFPDQVRVTYDYGVMNQLVFRAQQTSPIAYQSEYGTVNLTLKTEELLIAPNLVQIRYEFYQEDMKLSSKYITLQYKEE